MVRKHDSMSLCTVCRASSTAHARFATERCKGSAVQSWEARASNDVRVGPHRSGSHVQRLTGGILWCDVCGAYAELRAMGLAGACRRRPRDPAAAWRRNRLREGRHPVTGRPLGGSMVCDPLSFVSGDDGFVGGRWGSGAVATGAPICSSSTTRRKALYARVRAREAAGRTEGAAAA